jgi:NAD(P)-dependent dehydrogenase (short-subunit alcohol dehydrogenase family)
MAGPSAEKPVAPGAISTDMTKDYWDVLVFQPLNQETTPFHRHGAGVADAVCFLASAQGGDINGQAVDGGWATTRFLVARALNAECVGE